MRRVLGYVEGRAIWSENVPASPGSMPIRGELVVAYTPTAPSKTAEAARQRRRRRKLLTCSLTDRCAHGECGTRRAVEAHRLRASGLNYREIGVALGGRHPTTVSHLLRTRDAA